MIHLENVSKVYKNGTNALNNISLDIEDGEFVYFIGETGSGKSTLIRLLDGEEVPTKGSIAEGSTKTRDRETVNKDFAEIYENDGKYGVINAFKNKKQFSEFELLIWKLNLHI